jgi:hypothetical protein
MHGLPAGAQISDDGPASNVGSGNALVGSDAINALEQFRACSERDDAAALVRLALALS